MQVVLYNKLSWFVSELREMRAILKSQKYTYQVVARPDAHEGEFSSNTPKNPKIVLSKQDKR